MRNTIEISRLVEQEVSKQYQFKTTYEYSHFKYTYCCHWIHFTFGLIYYWIYFYNKKFLFPCSPCIKNTQYRLRVCSTGLGTPKVRIEGVHYRLRVSSTGGGKLFVSCTAHAQPLMGCCRKLNSFQLNFSSLISYP